MITQINLFLRKKFSLGFIRNYPFRTSTQIARKILRNKKDLLVAEIGTFRGENAQNILENFPHIKTLYLIDPWKEYLDYTGVENKMTSSILSSALKETIKRIKKFSDEAVKDLPEEMDFIYIDGNHEYNYVKKDMKNYYSKLKKGGILAGHDIMTPGVTKAFCEFVVENKLNPIIKHMDWIIIKK